MKCPICGSSTYRSMGGKDICPSCGYGSPTLAGMSTAKKVRIHAEPHAVDEPDPRLISANTRFAFKLFAELAEQDKGKNIFVSPSSVAFALAMTYNGANGETRQAMGTALGLHGLTLQEVNHANAVLMTTLANIDPEVRLAVANSLWAGQGIVFKPEFVQNSQSFYHAEVVSLDFGDSKARSVINGWVSEKTNGKISQIVDSIDPQTILILINAVYFKGSWSAQFDKANTREDSFALLDGTQKTVPMMSQSGRYDYLRWEGLQAVSLPYGQGRVSMYIFLPDQDSSLVEFQRRLTVERWDYWLTRFHETKGEIVLPRFRLEYESKLNDALQAIGMAIAFDQDLAEFGNMCPIPPSPNVYISEVKHKTFVEVNEEGTEAAAATSVTMTKAAEPTFSMKVDRPFFCAIRDNQTGAILFMGLIAEP